MKLDLYLLTSYIKVSSKLIKDLNVGPKTIKLLRKNRGQKFQNTGLGNDFLDITQRQGNKRKKIDRLDFIKF